MQPLGPGIHLAERHTDVGVAPDRVHVRVTDRLDNVGDRTLHSLGVRLPDDPTMNAQSVRVAIDGRNIPMQQTSTGTASSTLAPVNPPWERRQQREVVSEWDLVPQSTNQTNPLAGVAFYIAGSSALPLWQAPNGAFAKVDLSAKSENITVRVPSEFLVLASGKMSAGKSDGNSTIYKMRLTPDVDRVPYVVAGRYQERVVETPQGVVKFWTFQPLDPAASQIAATRIAATMHSLSDYFGPGVRGNTQPKKGATLRVVEASEQLTGGLGEGYGGVSFPDGALLDSRAISSGVASDRTIELAEFELAQTWFGWYVRANPTDEILLGRGMGVFSLVIAAESVNPQERQRAVGEILSRYDQARARAKDRPLLGAQDGYSQSERIAAGYRAGLFFVALEDLCGRENLRTALRRIVRSLGGDEMTDGDLRSAVEAASERDLAKMFRAWLHHPGIPEDFRIRYEHENIPSQAK